jgi:O-antigen ligase
VGYQPAGIATLSIAPDATRRVVIEVVAFSLLFLGTTRLLRLVSLDWLAGQLMGLAVAVSLIGIVQKVVLDVNEPLLYGFWRPREGGNPFGPFVNRNHFAGWMVMVLPVVAAYAWALVHRADHPEMTGSGPWLRWTGSVEGNRALLALSAVVILGTALVLTGSRSGMASFAVAVGVLTGFVLRRLHGRRRWVAAGYLTAVFLAAFVWAGVGVAAARFERAPAEFAGRLTAWRDTVRIIQDFPVFGTGLGGFGRAMLVYQSADRRATYAQAHNDYLQLAAEGGVVGAGAAAVVTILVGLAIRRRLRAGDADRVTYWVRRGAVAGLVGIAAQSLVEFSLQMPGNAVLCVVLAALAVHRPRSGPHAHRV